MASAKLYVSTNVVDRLTRPIEILEESINKSAVKTPQGGDDSMKTFDDSFDNGYPRSSVIDAATFIGSLQTGISNRSVGGSSVVNTPNYNRNRLRDNDDNSVNTTQSASKRKSNSKSFDTFLARQKLVLEKREQEIEKVSINLIMVNGLY
jgi:hypothetical protein